MRKTVLTIVLLTLVISCKNPKSETSQDQDLLIKETTSSFRKTTLFSKKSKPKRLPNRNTVMALFLPEQSRQSPIIMQKLPVRFQEELPNPSSGSDKMFRQTVLFLRFFLLITFRFRKIIQMP
jgi:hypothetical protein